MTDLLDLLSQADTEPRSKVPEGFSPDLLDAIRDRPIWRLTEEEIDLLDQKEQQWVRNALHDIKTDGSLAMILANPPGTKYETVWDRSAGSWKLHPLPSLAEQTLKNVIKGMSDEAARLQYFVMNWYLSAMEQAS